MLTAFALAAAGALAAVPALTPATAWLDLGLGPGGIPELMDTIPPPAVGQPRSIMDEFYTHFDGLLPAGALPVNVHMGPEGPSIWFTAPDGGSCEIPIDCAKHGAPTFEHRRTIDEAIRWIEGCERAHPGGVFVGISLHFDAARMPGPVKQVLHGMRAAYVWFAQVLLATIGLLAGLWGVNLAMPDTRSDTGTAAAVDINSRDPFNPTTAYGGHAPGSAGARVAWLAAAPLRWAIGGPGSTMDMHMEGTLYIDPALYSPLLSAAAMIWWDRLVGIFLSWGVLDQVMDTGSTPATRAGIWIKPFVLPRDAECPNGDINDYRLLLQWYNYTNRKTTWRSNSGTTQQPLHDVMDDLHLRRQRAPQVGPPAAACAPGGPAAGWGAVPYPVGIGHTAARIGSRVHYRRYHMSLGTQIGDVPHVPEPPHPQIVSVGVALARVV